MDDKEIDLLESPVDRGEFFRRAAGFGLAAGAGLAALSAAVKPKIAIAQTKESVRWGFLIDLRRCIGCKACVVACKTENDVRLGVFRNDVKELEMGAYPAVTRKLLPWLCNHCKDPICITKCPAKEVDATFTFPDGKKVDYKKKATYQRPDGLVLIDQDRCVGCGMCVKLCPYKVRFQDPVKPAGGLPSRKAANKCTMCAHRLDNGVVPSCVNTCQGGARIAGNLNDPASEISRLLASEKTSVLAPESGTNPQCFYIDLDGEVHSKGSGTLG